jgi:hypothetical protein
MNENKLVKHMSSIYRKMTDPENEVAHYLQERNLWWVFHFPVFVKDEEDIPRLYAPDFYIPKLGLFIEVCGSTKFNYQHRYKVYKKNGIPVVFLHYYKHPKEWKSYLAKRIAEIERQRETESKKLRDF